MAQGIPLDAGVKELISNIYTANSDWRAKQVREVVLKQVHRVSKYPDPNWPGLSSIQKEMAIIRGKWKARGVSYDSKDYPWSALDIAKYPIHPEALPVIMEAWGDQRLKDNYLTIREVLWIARFHFFFKEVKPQNEKLRLIIGLAKLYALHEKAGDVAGDHPDKTGDMWFRWQDDMLLYGCFPVKDGKPLIFAYPGLVESHLEIMSERYEVLFKAYLKELWEEAANKIKEEG